MAKRVFKFSGRFPPYQISNVSDQIIGELILLT